MMGKADSGLASKTRLARARQVCLYLRHVNYVPIARGTSLMVAARAFGSLILEMMLA
jgi:hypothetical protein